MPRIRVDKKRRNPKYRPYGKDSQVSAAAIISYSPLVRWPAWLIGVGLMLVVLLVLPPPSKWVDWLLDLDLSRLTRAETVDVRPVVR